MAKHTHDFVETYNDMIAFGFDRQHDEIAVIYYLQKLSDDTMIKELVKRMTDSDLEEMFNFVDNMLKKHLEEPEYHTLFLKEEDHHH